MSLQPRHPERAAPCPSTCPTGVARRRLLTGGGGVALAATVAACGGEGQEGSTDVEPATGADGEVRVFFELNGQSRQVRVPKAGVAAAFETPKADEGDSSHVGAPMPGMVVRVAVQKGQVVAKGEPLLALEAMKMETVLGAPRDGKVKAIHVKPGATVNTRDLLIELE